MSIARQHCLDQLQYRYDSAFKILAVTAAKAPIKSPLRVIKIGVIDIAIRIWPKCNTL
jgi:hypothetical protein